MNQAFLSDLRALAIDPASRGLGYVVLEGPDTLVEWGFRNARAEKEARRVGFVRALLARYQPDVLVLEAYGERQRSGQTQNLVDAFAMLAEDRGVQVYRVPRAKARVTFAATNKYAIAGLLLPRFPELKLFFPPRRKIWQSENPRINIFDALALAVAAFRDWTADIDNDHGCGF